MYIKFSFQRVKSEVNILNTWQRMYQLSEIPEIHEEGKDCKITILAAYSVSESVHKSVQNKNLS